MGDRENIIYLFQVHQIININILYWGMQWCSWLRHCTTSQKVAGSSPSVVTGIFHQRNPSGHTMALGSIQLLTEMSTRNISLGGSQCIGLTPLPPSHADCHEICEPQPPGILSVCPGTALPFFYLILCFIIQKTKGLLPRNLQSIFCFMYTFLQSLWYLQWQILEYDTTQFNTWVLLFL